jgi:excisionase family DNA binding protein
VSLAVIAGLVVWTDNQRQRSRIMSKKNDREPDEEGAGLPYLMRIEAVAEHLGVSVRHVRRLVQERRIPHLKWGHFVLFDPAELAPWLEQFRRPEGGGERWA